MRRESLHRWFFLGLAVLLGGFAIFSFLGVALAVAEDSYANHDGVAIVIAIVLVLALAALAAWLAHRSWRRAKSN